MNNTDLHANSCAPTTDGMVRLWVAGSVAFLSFFQQMFLEYLPPLYFNALRASTQVTEDLLLYPADLWSQFIKYQTTAWLIGPLIAGIMARHYGERKVWSFAQFAMAPITLLLIFRPDPIVIMAIGFWSGITGSLIWIGGISLMQMTSPDKKGLSNGIMMFSLGAGSFLAPVCGRTMIYWRVIKPELLEGNWTNFTQQMLNIQQIDTIPKLSDFNSLLWLLTALTLVCGILIGLYGQYPGKFARDESNPGWASTFRNLLALMSNPVFWAIVISMSCFGGPIFQGSNQFLPYRAADLGLTVGAADHGWAWLNMSKTLMWVLGGAAVGLVAGRKVGAIAGIVMLGGFAIGSLCIAHSNVAWQLFASVIVFELMRQFIRWSQTGWLSEHIPGELRATGIGVSCTIAGVSSTIFAWVAGYIWNADQPQFNSSNPFYTAFFLGIVGCVVLGVCSWFHPFNRPLAELRKTDNDKSVESPS